VGREAARERWGFAFSAKAEWRPKVRSDVAKIAETDRGYAKAFFVTNQAVADRTRAEVEDTLRTEHGIDVRILDRTWILDRVFEGGHEALAVEELGVTALSRREVKKGPLDAKREEDLEESEARIREAFQAGRLGTALVEEALAAAVLACELERPRAEVEGRFSRVDQLAREHGTPRQRVEIAYQWSWTLFWWFEDYDAFVAQYDVVKERVSGSRNVYDLERLTNLWQLLNGARRRGTLDPEGPSWSVRTESLVAELERLRGEKDRPSTALQAETLLYQVGMMRRLAADEPFDDELCSLRDVVLRSEGLVGYPLEPLAEILTEVSEVLERSPAYDELFETIVEVTSAREGEVRAARLLLTRGEGQLRQGRPLDAITTLGRALGRLHKHETRRDIVRALYLCGCAYDEVGLPWAARGTLLAAASIATNELWSYGDVTPYQAACYRRLKWIELQLGRLPHLLAWHEIDLLIRYDLSERGHDLDNLFVDDDTFQGLLGSLLLRTDLFDLRALRSLPDVLDRLELPIATDTLLYALGYEERFREATEEMEENPKDFARRLRDASANAPIPARPELYNRQTVSLHSRVLGCRVTVNSKIDPPCIEIAESMLAALESFLATSIFERAIAREPQVTVEIRISEFTKGPAEVTVEERAGRPHFSVRCRPFNPHELSLDEQTEVRDAVIKIAMTSLEHIVMFKDLERDLEALFREERVLERAFGFTGTFGTQANIFGAAPKTRLAAWTEEEAHLYPLQRTEPWDPAQAGEEDHDNGLEPTTFKKGGGSPPELLDPNARSHDQVETVSLIRERLWGRAEWTGVAFATDPTHQSPPVLALIFRNHDAGREIFKQWRQELGTVDVQEQLRLTVVRGIDRDHPHAYRVIVGSDHTAFPTNTRFVTFVSRIHRMDAATSENLNRFLQAHEAVGALSLAPAFASSDFDGSQAPNFGFELSIGIHQVHVLQAWEIGPDDVEAVAIHENDHPIVPENIETPPVNGILRG
jgi:tetratricopeptide (TPR) repeat protein